MHQKNVPRKERKYTRKRSLNQNMKIVQKNPWNVESIQDFSCLKCPECAFFTKEENYFENHAIKKHLLSAVFFDEKSSHEIEDKVKDKVQVDVNHVDIDNIKKNLLTSRILNMIHWILVIQILSRKKNNF